MRSLKSLLSRSSLRYLLWSPAKCNHITGQIHEKHFVHELCYTHIHNNQPKFNCNEIRDGNANFCFIQITSLKKTTAMKVTSLEIIIMQNLNDLADKASEKRKC